MGWGKSATWPHRNGGRHCCQPPLRRAKDLPVFATWLIRPFGQTNPLSILAHQLRRRLPPDRSLLRGARSTYLTARPEGSLVFRSFRPGVWNRSPSKPKPSSVLRPFLGQSLLRPASLTRPHEGVRKPRRAREDRLFRRLFPAGPRRTEALPIPAGGDRTFGHLPPEGGRDRRPDHPCTMHA